MEQGIAKALSEITLIVFTTFGPAGAVAFVMTSLFFCFGTLEKNSRIRLGRFLIVPVFITMVGLVASATHLGTPSNALYVLTGIGRSPLSNEVGSGILFLAFSAGLWFSSFSLKDYKLLRKILTIASVAAGIFFIQTTAIVYAVETIPTWDSAYTPATQWMLALILGSLIALLTLTWAEIKECKQFELAVFIVSSGALLLGLILFALQNAEFATVENSWISAHELIPWYGLMIVVFAVIETIAVVLIAPFKGIRNYIPRLPFVACVVSSLGVFMMRFAFYMMHMTVGF